MRESSLQILNPDPNISDTSDSNLNKYELVTDKKMSETNLI